MSSMVASIDTGASRCIIYLKAAKINTAGRFLNFFSKAARTLAFLLGYEVTIELRI